MILGRLNDILQGKTLYSSVLIDVLNSLSIFKQVQNFKVILSGINIFVPVYWISAVIALINLYKEFKNDNKVFTKEYINSCHTFLIQVSKNANSIKLLLISTLIYILISFDLLSAVNIEAINWISLFVYIVFFWSGIFFGSIFSHFLIWLNSNITSIQPTYLSLLKLSSDLNLITLLAANVLIKFYVICSQIILSLFSLHFNPFLISMIGFSFYVANYIYISSSMAKISDIVADNSDDKQQARIFSNIDQQFDLLADGMFSKLIITCLLFYLENENALFNLQRWVGVFYITIEILNRLNYNLDTYKAENLALVLPFIGYLIDEQNNLTGTMILGLTFKLLCGRTVRDNLKWVVEKDGRLQNLTLTLSFATLAPAMFSLVGPTSGLLTTYLLLNLDQIGYLADILEDNSSDKDYAKELDIYGNAVKGLFKTSTLLTLSGLYQSDDVRFWSQIASLFASIAIHSYQFYTSIDKASKSSEISNSVELYNHLYNDLNLVKMLPLVISYKSSYLTSIVLITSGALADNLKKVHSGNTKMKADLIKNDLAGDYMKDVVFPIMISRTFIFTITDYLSIIEDRIKALVVMMNIIKI